jgi:hypothetical protein
MALVLTATQQAALSFTVVDAKGNPASIDGTPTWSSVDPSTVMVEPATDGMTAVVKAVGPVTTPGTSVQVSVSVDADLGAGVTPLVGTLDVSVLAGTAVAVSLAAGTPEEQA